MKNKYDVVVVGGGFSGVAAAISAAKNGASVLLIEKYNCLGGAASVSLVSPFMFYWSIMPDTKKRKYLCGNLFQEIVAEMNKIIYCDEGNTEPTIELYDEEILKLVLNRMVKKAHVDVLFNTFVTDATVDNGTVLSVKAIGKTHKLEFFADCFIDATGDAELSTLAGCEFVLGRAQDNLCQPMTLCFRLGGVDKEKFRKNKPKINELYRKFKADGLIKNPRENVLTFDNINDGVIHINSTRVVMKNPTDVYELTEAEFEAREQVFELHNFLKNNIEGFENSRVLSTGMHIGIRESRKIVGDYTLTEQDLLSLKRFEDGIAAANYAIDIHNPEGGGTRCEMFGEGEWYEIPYRCLIPKSTNNLLVAGRCISTTHEAQSSYRIMPYCAELGQAAGTAAALAVRNKTTVRDIDITKLRNMLKEEGFSI